MIPVVFINCDTIPFLDLIMNLDKLIETRTRNTLRALVGQRVYLAETHHGKRPVIRCMCVIGDAAVARSREAWETCRPSACIPAGSKYDWQENTRAKWVYWLENVRPVIPFTPPEGRRHGRVWMEYDRINHRVPVSSAGVLLNR